MVQQSKRLLSYPAFIVLFAYTARMAVFFYMSYMWHATPKSCESLPALRV